MMKTCSDGHEHIFYEGITLLNDCPMCNLQHDKSAIIRDLAMQKRDRDADNDRLMERVEELEKQNKQLTAENNLLMVQHDALRLRGILRW